MNKAVDTSREVEHAYEFEQFIRSILEHSDDIDLVNALTEREQAYGSDFVAVSRGGRPLLIEAKSTTPQTSARLSHVSNELKAAAQRYKQLHPDANPQLILAIPGVLAEVKKFISSRSGLTVWDGPYLRERARTLGVEAPPFLAYESPLVGGWHDPTTKFTHVLLRQLPQIRPGQDDWLAYEKFCENLLNFLFAPPLKPAIPQSRDDRHVNRRDYVLPNYALDGGFWQFMRVHYEAHMLVAEVKNLNHGPGKQEILQVANYLNPHGTGLFALVLARHELTETAKWICREQWVQHNKLIVGIDDDDVKQMIDTKLRGNDPAELVRQKIEDFRLGI